MTPAALVIAGGAIYFALTYGVEVRDRYFQTNDQRIFGHVINDLSCDASISGASNLDTALRSSDLYNQVEVVS